MNGLENALSSLKGILQDGILRRIIVSMIANCNEEELVNYEVYDAKRKSFEQVSQKRDFYWNSTDLTVINCDFFFNEPLFSDITMIAFEKICFEENSRKNLLSYILNNSGRNEYYVIFNRNTFVGVDSWKLYMFALFMCVNKGDKIQSNSALTYFPTQHNSAIHYEVNAKYEQYIDIYDVISEWNVCKDVLNAFLKMYQILEYMVYRKEFVTIVSGANIKQSFVRQIKGLDRKFSNSERETFIKGLPSILSSFDGYIQDTLVTPDVEAFCLKFYPLTSNGNTYMTANNVRNAGEIDHCISKFIYDVRCSLVHNKESEFHMTMTNYEEYAPLVPLMKKIMEVVGEKIMETINNPTNKIFFSNRELLLF